MPHQHDHRDPACLEVFAKLSAYIDGELDTPDCAHIKEHIADCPPCIEFLESLRKSVEASKDFAATADCGPVPPALEEKLRAAWEAALKRKQS